MIKGLEWPVGSRPAMTVERAQFLFLVSMLKTGFPAARTLG